MDYSRKLHRTMTVPGLARSHGHPGGRRQGTTERLTTAKVPTPHQSRVRVRRLRSLSVGDCVSIIVCAAIQGPPMLVFASSPNIHGRATPHWWRRWDSYHGRGKATTFEHRHDVRRTALSIQAWLSIADE